MDLPGANYRAIFKPKRKIKRKYILKKLFYFSKTFLPKKYLIPSKTYFLITHYDGCWFILPRERFKSKCKIKKLPKSKFYQKKKLYLPMHLN